MLHGRCVPPFTHNFTSLAPMRQTLLILILALAAGAGGFLAYRLLQGEPSALIGQTAPALQFTDLDGRAHHLDELRGRWVLLNFWASWCAPCMDELPHLVEAQSLYGPRGLQILGPALDEAAAIKPMITRFRINYPVMADFVGADAAMQALGNTQGALPYSVLIDPEGHIRELHLGGMSRESLAGLLDPHLKP